MGYFFELNLEMQYEKHQLDRNYPSPEQQIVWRIEDLKSRLIELGMVCPSDEIVYGYDDISRASSVEYSLPEFLASTKDVLIALAAAYRKFHDLEAHTFCQENRNAKDEVYCFQKYQCKHSIYPAA
jgi:hypothetical protein